MYPLIFSVTIHAYNDVTTGSDHNRISIEFDAFVTKKAQQKNRQVGRKTSEIGLKKLKEAVEKQLTLSEDIGATMDYDALKNLSNIVADKISGISETFAGNIIKKQKSLSKGVVTCMQRVRKAMECAMQLIYNLATLF